MADSPSVAVGDEQGYVCIVHTEDQDPQSRLHRMQCHKNAIFDLTWVIDASKLLTASGDQTIALHDVTSSTPVRRYRGHRGSVKTVSAFDAFTFASGGRDGTICLWDSRLAAGLVSRLKCAHQAASGQGGDASAARLSASNAQSVSCVCVADGMTLASAGATDGLIKIWDTRALRCDDDARVDMQTAQPLGVVCPPPRPGFRRRGITSLTVNPPQNRLLATTMDGRTHLYPMMDNLCAATIPASFEGHRVDSFYVKSQTSADGLFVASGSSDCNLYLWDALQPGAQPLVLQGHTSEVTAIASRGVQPGTLVSVGDDAVLRRWSSA